MQGHKASQKNKGCESNVVEGESLRSIIVSPKTGLSNCAESVVEEVKKTPGLELDPEVNLEHPKRKKEV